MAKVPRPHEIGRELESVHEGFLTRLVDHYRHGYVDAYSQSRGGTDKFQKFGPVDHGGAISDPTGNTVVGKEGLRNAVARAGAKILEGCKALDAADAILSDIAEKGKKYEPKEQEIKDGLSAEELAQAKGYQAKRLGK